MEIASVTTVLAPLAVLACPVGMGLMMWLMARGNRSEQRSDRQHRILIEGPEKEFEHKHTHTSEAPGAVLSCLV